MGAGLCGREVAPKLYSQCPALSKGQVQHGRVFWSEINLLLCSSRCNTSCGIARSSVLLSSCRRAKEEQSDVWSMCLKEKRTVLSLESLSLAPVNHRHKVREIGKSSGAKGQRSDKRA